MPRDPVRSLHIILIAGEASGDILGAGLMRALKKQYSGDVQFSGVGGILMQAEGMNSLFPMQELSVMGVAEILPKIGALLKRIRQTADFITAQKPDIVVTIDSPDFSFRVARKAQNRTTKGPLWVHYVAPTVWAWRPERAKKVAALYDGLVCLFPFEPEYFTREGMSASFTGHPLMEQHATLEGGQAFRRAQGIPDEAFVLGVLFGSRSGELKRMGGILRESILQAIRGGPFHPNIVAPTLPHLKAEAEDLLKAMPCAVHVVSAPEDKWPAFAAMDAALAVSGTVGLELAVAGVPHVIAYRMNRLTWEIVNRQVKVPYAHLANILLNDRVVPECLQDQSTPKIIADALLPLFSRNSAAATAQRKAFAGLRGNLTGTGDRLPSEQAAQYVLDLYYSRSLTGT